MAFYNETIENSVGNYQVKIDSSDTNGDYLINKLLAGTNITLVESNVGLDEKLTINASGAGSANVSTESLVGTQSGTSVTLDLTGLAHVFTSVLLVFRNGQLLTPTASWSLSGSTMTILNASATNTFLINYTY